MAAPTSAVAALGAPRTTRKAQSEAVVAATWAASWVSLLKPPLRKTGPNPKKRMENHGENLGNDGFYLTNGEKHEKMCTCFPKTLWLYEFDA